MQLVDDELLLLFMVEKNAEKAFKVFPLHRKSCKVVVVVVVVVISSSSSSCSSN